MESSNTQTRSPVIVVMGHIDHGKTTLLDAIRKANVVAREAGGITQHVGAYEIEHNGKKMTFLDTPGHEAFRAIRERGARAADIAILVVAAEDSLKPQSLEALKAIEEANIPFIVAANKIDKPEANIEKLKKDLAEHNVLVEDWGGQIPLVGISAKQQTNIEKLLEMVELMAAIAELKTDVSHAASGVVIESTLDARRGASATMIIQDGTLHEGDFVVAGGAMAKGRLIEDFLGNKITEAAASAPVRVVGFDVPPPVGAIFHAYVDKKEAEQAAKDSKKVVERADQEVVADKVVMPIYLKADVAGSLEALESEIRKMDFNTVQLKIVGSGVGAVNESDVKAVANEKNAIEPLLLAFNVKIGADGVSAAERYSVRMGTFTIIYEALDWVRAMLAEIVPKQMTREELGRLDVLRVFRLERGSGVVGGKVIDGDIAKGKKFDVERKGKVIAKGVVDGVESDKQKVESVHKGQMCGLAVSGARDIMGGDVLVVFDEKEMSV
jgi:translation initiation factor IF-2